MCKRLCIQVVFLFSVLLFPGWAKGQISAPGSDATVIADYPEFQGTDSIYIFCSADSLLEEAVLRASTNLTGTKTFYWEQYNSQTGSFDFYFSESTDNGFSEPPGPLANGCYQVTITQGESTEVHRAWVFNDWTIAEAYISDSDCEGFTLNGNYKTAELTYYDLSNNNELTVAKNLQNQWIEGETVLASSVNYREFNPPYEDTEYTYRVYSETGCESTVDVLYESIVVNARFSVDPPNGEAPLTVNFNNESENGDPGQYEWFFFRDIDEIKRESEDTGQPVDSIMIIAFDDDPVYTYENSGRYNVKMVAKNLTSPEGCVDTVYIDDMIVVDTSFIVVPNVFTPNGDGTNDQFVVKFWSMKSIKISIFNRWGKRIHFWKSSDVRGFEGTWTETVWDGRLLGGRFASPGVYYYTVVGEGRDGESRRKHGFFHLFRGKD